MGAGDFTSDGSVGSAAAKGYTSVATGPSVIVPGPKAEEEDQGTTIVDEENNSTLTYFRDGKLKFKPCMSHIRYEKVKRLLEQLVDCGIYLDKLLDIGSGDNSFLHLAVVKMPCIKEVVCIDKEAEKLTREKAVWQPADDRRALPLAVKVIKHDFGKMNLLPRPASQSKIVTLIEVLEHLELIDVPRVMVNIFGIIKPSVIVITTPNTDFNIDFPIPGGRRFRHLDHKFEWSSLEFKSFCEEVTLLYDNYSVAMTGCGLGKHGRYCTQIAVFIENSIKKNAKITNTKPGVTNLITELLKGSQSKKSDCDDWRAKDIPKGKTSKNYGKDMQKMLDTLARLSRTVENRTTKKVGTRAPNKKISPMTRDTTVEYYKDEFSLVHHAVYDDAKTMMHNEIVYHIGCFIWSLDSRNTVYPYTDKLLKVDRRWDYLNALPLGHKETIKPVRVGRDSIEDYKRRIRYTDVDDGACNSSHRSHTIKCDKCPFVYVKTVPVCGSEETPKQLTRQLWQSNIIYLKNDRTLWFSFVLIKRYLGLGNDYDNILRKALGSAGCQRCFLLNTQCEYYCYKLQRQEDELRDGEQTDTEDGENQLQRDDGNADEKESSKVIGNSEENTNPGVTSNVEKRTVELREKAGENWQVGENKLEAEGTMERKE